MSNHLSIATVTAVLQRTLQEAVQGDVFGARVTTVRPINLGDSPSESGVNIFLYQVSANPALNNIDATPLRSKGRPTKRQAALDLYYMLSFYGKDTELEPQRILGSVVRTLNDRRIITSEMIRETLVDSNFAFLEDSNLAEQIQQINISPIDVDLEELSKAWSGFFQTNYLLSIVYKVLVVLIAGTEPWKRALPIQDRNLGGMVPFPHKPVIEQVVSQEGRLKPIFADSKLLIRGKNLKGNIIQVRLGGIEATPQEVSEKQVSLSLSDLPGDSLRAGVQSLQVIHQISAAIKPQSNNGRESGNGNSTDFNNRVESNAAPFVLCPTITELSVSDIETRGDQYCSVELLVETNLTIEKTQRVVLALNEWSTEDSAAYLFDAPARRTETNSITFSIPKIKIGEYLVRLMVDGAESKLDIDENRDSQTFGWYIAPKIIIREDGRVVDYSSSL